MKRISSFLFTGLMFLAGNVRAEAPNLITYQGRLKENNLPVSDNRLIEIRFCDALTLGNCYPNPAGVSAQSVTVANGLFKSTVTVPVGVDLSAGPWYLAVYVGGTELTPREQFTSVPFALYAGSATVAATVADGAVTDAKVAAGISQSKILSLTTDLAAKAVAADVAADTNTLAGRFTAVAADTATLKSQLDGKVAKTGETMTGQLTVMSSVTVAGGALAVGSNFLVSTGAVTGIGDMSGVTLDTNTALHVLAKLTPSTGEGRVAVFGDARSAGSAAGSMLLGGNFESTVNGADAAEFVVGSRAKIRRENAGFGVVASAYGMLVDDIQLESGAGTITNTYGVYIGSMAGNAGTQTNAPYALYSMDPAARSYFAGNVGIGTSAPAAKLELPEVGAGVYEAIIGKSIGGSPYISGAPFPAPVEMQIGNDGGNSSLRLGQGVVNNLMFYWHYNATAANAYGVLETYAGNNNLVLQNAGGNVGIGTTAPAHKLAVTGGIVAASSITAQGGFYGDGSGLTNVPAGSIPAEITVSTISATATTPYGGVNITSNVFVAGSIGIGTTSPADKLNVFGNIRVTDTQGKIAVYDGVSEVASLSDAASGGGNGVLTLNYGANVTRLSANGNSYFNPGNNGNIGIGMTGPEQKLTVAGNISQTGVVISSGTGNNYFAGSVGIGTASPVYRLDVASNTRIFNADDAPTLLFSKNSADVPGTSGYSAAITGAQESTARGLAFHTQYQGTYSEKMRVTGTGSVGIGTADPQAKLHVFSTSTTDSAVFIASHAAAGYGLFVSTSGRVGVGTAAPAETSKLEIKGGPVGVLAVNPRVVFGQSDFAAQIEINGYAGGANNSVFGTSPGDFAIRRAAGKKLVFGRGDAAPADMDILIDGIGRVGIGTTDPSAKLSVAGTMQALDPGLSKAVNVYHDGTDARVESSAGKLYLKSNVGGTDHIVLDASGGSVGIATTTPAGLFQVGGGSLTVLADGRVGIGTVAPTARLHISGKPGVDGIRFPDGSFMTTAGAGSANSLANTGNAVVNADSDGIGEDGLVRFQRNGVDVFYISTSGAVGIGSTNPTASLYLTASGDPAVTAGIRFPDGSILTTASIGAAGQISNASDGVVNADADGDGSGAVRLQTNGADKLYISNTGKVGIGAANPAYRLVVSSGAGEAGTLVAVSTGGVDVIWMTGSGEVHANRYFGDGSGLTGVVASGAVQKGGDTMTGDLYMGNSSTITIAGNAFSVGGSTFVVKAGRVGVGTASPTAALEVAGQVKLTGGGIVLDAGQQIQLASGDPYSWLRRSVSGSPSLIQVGGTGGRFEVLDTFLMSPKLIVDLPTGNVGISTGAPQARLDVRAAGSGASDTVQIWRNSAGTAVSSVSATGVMMASKFVGDGSGLTGVISTGAVQKAGDTMTGPLTMFNSSITVTGANGIGVAYGISAATISLTGDMSAARYLISGSTVVAILPGNGSLGIGVDAGRVNTGNYNVFVGLAAGYYNQTGSANTLLGYRAGQGTVSNFYSSSTLVGYQSGYGLTTGSDNILLGFQAGDNLTTGSRNIIIGYDLDATAPTISNEIRIGSIIYGNMNTGGVAIGYNNTLPAAALDVKSTSTLATDYAQIWRNSDSTIVASMTATGKIYGDGSGLTGVVGDNLGSHTATQSLNMAGNRLVNVSTMAVTGLAGGVVIVPSLDATKNYAYQQGVAIGSDTYDNSWYAVGIGFSAYGNTNNGVGVGGYAYGNASQGVGVGYQAFNNDNNGTGLGAHSYYNNDFGTGVGAETPYNQHYGVGVGAYAQSNKYYAVGVGAYSMNNMPYGAALGAYSYAASSSVALGYMAKATAWNSVAIGSGTVNSSTGTASFGILGIYTSSDVYASKFHGDGSGLTGVVASGAVQKAGDTMTGPLTLSGSTITVTGSAFSVGGSTLAVTGGKVGIGTSAPIYELHVKNTYGRAYLESAAGSTAWLGLGHDSNAYWTVKNNGGGGDYFSINNLSNAPFLAILQGGNVGVGSTYPMARLHITENSGASSYILVASTEANTGSYKMVVSTSGSIGVRTLSPAAALDIAAMGAAITDYAQIWRNSAGTVVASMTATGALAVSNSAIVASPSYIDPDNYASATTIIGAVIDGAWLGSSAVGGRATSSGTTWAIGHNNASLLFGAGDMTSANTMQTFMQVSQYRDVSLVPTSGDVAIGHTSPTALLHLKGGVITAGGAPLKFTAGNTLAIAEQGAVEYDGKAFYASLPVSSRAVVAAQHFIRQNSDFTGQNLASAQPVFNATANGRITVPAYTSYYFEGQYLIHRTVGGTAHTISILFGGSAAFSGFSCVVQSTNTTNVSGLAPLSVTYVTSPAAMVVTAGNSSPTEYATILFKGIMQIGVTGGTIIPQFQYSAIPGGAPTIKAGTYFRMIPLGTDAATSVGAWD